MEKVEYNRLIINNELDKLANINIIDDLVKYQYLYRFLIEYLLEKGIHTNIMDSKVKYHSTWINFYLKYNILKPLLNAHLEPLLETFNGRQLFDMLLEKLDNDERIELYHNLKNNSYWLFRIHEKEIIMIYQKYGITLPQIFINEPVVNQKITPIPKGEIELFNEFRELFKDSDEKSLNFYISEFRKMLVINKERTIDDITKLINYKKKHHDFKLLLSKDTEGEYDPNLKRIVISPYRNLVLSHELSHLLYHELDGFIDDNYLEQYKNIQKKIKPNIIKKITDYLNRFHQRFYLMHEYFQKIYDIEIKKKYQSFDKYVKVVSEDILNHHPEMITLDDDVVIFYVNDEIEDTVMEILEIEKEEYVNKLVRNYYSEELMLENLLDALLMGKIFDGMLDIECLSGHSGMDFMDDKDLSFNECLADYDAIKNSRKADRLINDLQGIIGSDLISFLDDYLRKNRGHSYGNR